MTDNKYLAHLVHYIENLMLLTQYYYINFQEFNIWSNELEFFMYIAHFFMCKCSVLYLKIRNFIGRLKSAPGEKPQKPWKKHLCRPESRAFMLWGDI